MSMHVPTLPSKPSWETPIAASRDIVEAISDVADSAVDVATSAVRSARRRRSGGRSLRSSWRWVLAAVVLAAAAFAMARRRASSGSPSNAAGPASTTVDPDGVGRSEHAHTDGSIQEYDDDVLAEAAAGQARSSIAD